MAYISNCGDDAELGLNPSRTEVHSAEETRQKSLAVKCDCCADKLAAMAQAIRDEDVEKMRFAYDAVSLCDVIDLLQQVAQHMDVVQGHHNPYVIHACQTEVKSRFDDTQNSEESIAGGGMEGNNYS